MKKELNSKESFLKTLNNFISKCPVTLEKFYNDYSENCIVRIMNDDNTIAEDVNLSMFKDKHKEIETLRNIVIKYCPTLWYIDYKTPSVDVLTEKIQNGKLTLSEALSYKEKTEITLGKLLRIHHRYNEIDVLSSDGSILKYKCNVPLISLLLDWKKSNYEIDLSKLNYVKNINTIQYGGFYEKTKLSTEY